jgi:hypothetical protein
MEGEMLVNMRKILLVAFFFALLTMPLLAALPAWAIDSGTVEYDYPTLGIVYVGFVSNPIPFTAPQTVVFTSNVPDIQNVISPTSINISALTNSSFLSVGVNGFNGEVYRFPIDTITSISVTQNQGATVTFDAHDIWVDFAGGVVSWTQGVSFVDIQVSSIDGTSTVPEPSTLLLFGGGLVGLAAYRKKFKKA